MLQIIQFNFQEIAHKVCEYELKNGEKPIILMNETTLKILEEENIKLTGKKHPNPIIFDCYIAIANYLSFGEVELK